MGWALTGRRFGTHQCWPVCIWATHQRRGVRAPWRRVGHLIRLVGFRKASPRSAPPPLAPLYSSIPPFLSSLAALLLFAGWVRREAVKRVLFYSSPSSLLLGFYISDEKKDRRQSTQSNVFSCSFCNSSRVLSSVQLENCTSSFLRHWFLWWQVWYDSSTGYWLP
jgi:hypothetical protein